MSSLLFARCPKFQVGDIHRNHFVFVGAGKLIQTARDGLVTLYDHYAKVSTTNRLRD